LYSARHKKKQPLSEKEFKAHKKSETANLKPWQTQYVSFAKFDQFSPKQLILQLQSLGFVGDKPEKILYELKVSYGPSFLPLYVEDILEYLLPGMNHKFIPPRETDRC